MTEGYPFHAFFRSRRGARRRLEIADMAPCHTDIQQTDARPARTARPKTLGEGSRV